MPTSPVQVAVRLRAQAALASERARARATPSELQRLRAEVLSDRRAFDPGARGRTRRRP